MSAGTGAVTHRRILGLALPMTLAHLSTPLLGFVDTVVIGRLGEPQLLAGLAIAAVIFDFLFWGFGFLRLGTGGLTAQAVGAGDVAEQKAVLWRALLLAAVIGGLLVLLQVPIRLVALRLMSASPEATASAGLYYDIRIWSAPFALANYTLLGWLIGRGRTDLGFALQLGLNLCNIVLAVAAVQGLGLGVAGSAGATLIAEALAAVAGLAVTRHLLAGTARPGRESLLDRTRLLRLLAINRDLMIRSLSLIFAFAFFAAQGARAGDVTVAANALLMNLFMVSAYFLDGFATAAEQLAGVAIGARDRLRFRRAVGLSAGWCLGFGAVASAVLLLAGPHLVDFMTTSPAVRAVARDYLWLAALTPLAGALAFCFDGVYAGATWTGVMRNLMLLAAIAFLATWWLLRPLGNLGLWLALLSFLLVRGLGQLAMYFRLEVATFAGSPQPAATAAASRPVSEASPPDSFASASQSPRLMRPTSSGPS